MTSTGCRVIHGQDAYAGKQGLQYFAGVSAENVGARALCLHLLVIPPGGRAKAHLHEHQESAVYLISGDVEVWWGDELQERSRMQSGDFMYIPAGVPHLPVNISVAEPARAVIARTDPSEQESVVLLPQMDDVP